MSGVEVAGLVLGCLPLIIQGIESYNEGLDPVKSFVRWERELPQLIRKLRNQHVHYAQTMRILLEPITTEFELAEMLSGPGNVQLWKDKEMAEKLEGRLQDSYFAYQSTIADIEQITKKIASKLDLDRAAELTRNDLEAIIAANPRKSNDKFEFRKRIRFGMSKKSIKALLEELGECNKELERFTSKSETIETFRKTVKPSFAKRLQRIQNYAISLHESVTSCWSCSCSMHHKTSLQLDQRGSLYASGIKKANQPPKTCFKVSFSSSPQEATHVWTWQAAEIFVEDDDDHATLQPVTKPRVTKAVSFGSDKPPPYAATDPGPYSSAAREEVRDLCASIQQLYKSSSCISFSLDSKSKLWGAYPVDRVVQKQMASTEVVTLEELLNRPPLVNGRPAKLSKKERYSLAVTLASSTLQLNATPWFPASWCGKDVFFQKIDNGTRVVDIDYPYVAPKLDEVQKAMVNGRKPRGFQNKNTVLLALAIALLELYFGVSAEKHQEAEHGTTEGFSRNPWALCAIAYEWADEEQENMSAAFSGAVNHCLRCFSDPGASLADAEFLQAAVECIILPLQNELYQFLGKPGP